MIGVCIVGLYSLKSEKSKVSDLDQIPAAKWIQMFDNKKPTKQAAKLFREHFGLPPTQEVMVTAETQGSGAYGPVLVARIFENGIDTKKRYLAFVFYPSILKGFKGIIFIDTSNLAISGIEIKTVPSIWLKSGENYKVNINIQSTDQNGKRIEPRYDLEVKIGKESQTFNLSCEKLVEIFGANFTGANFYWFTNLPK